MTAHLRVSRSYTNLYDPSIPNTIKCNPHSLPISYIAAFRTMDGRATDLHAHITAYLPSHPNITLEDVLVDFKAEGRTLMHMAASSGHSDIMKLILDMASSNKQKGNSKNTTALLKRLVNVIDDRGFSPLMYATIAECDQSMQLLLKHGANVGHQNKDGVTAVHFAASDDSVARMSILASYGANMTILSSSGGNPLHWAASKGLTKATQYLLDFDPIYSLQYNEGNQENGQSDVAADLADPTNVPRKGTCDAPYM
jgi:hypothetical protein